uniref:Uncharacterized protein n=1 Tax=Ditylum brightwellii TaxID=49249 RepID=A0A7S4VQF5_9STRA
MTKSGSAYRQSGTKRGLFDYQWSQQIHDLLYACLQGAAPHVINYLAGWDKKRGRKFEWSHCNSDKDGGLVLAARSGFLTLDAHLFSLGAMDTIIEIKASIKVLNAGIGSINEELVLFALNHNGIANEIDNTNIVQSHYNLKAFGPLNTEERLQYDNVSVLKMPIE